MHHCSTGSSVLPLIVYALGKGTLTGIIIGATILSMHVVNSFILAECAVVKLKTQWSTDGQDYIGELFVAKE